MYCEPTFNPTSKGKENFSDITQWEPGERLPTLIHHDLNQRLDLIMLVLSISSSNALTQETSPAPSPPRTSTPKPCLTTDLMPTNFLGIAGPTPTGFSGTELMGPVITTLRSLYKQDLFDGITKRAQDQTRPVRYMRVEVGI